MYLGVVTKLPFPPGLFVEERRWQAERAGWLGLGVAVQSGLGCRCRHHCYESQQ